MRLPYWINKGCGDEPPAQLTQCSNADDYCITFNVATSTDSAYQNCLLKGCASPAESRTKCDSVSEVRAKYSLDCHPLELLDIYFLLCQSSCTWLAHSSNPHLVLWIVWRRRLQLGWFSPCWYDRSLSFGSCNESGSRHIIINNNKCP